MSKVTDWGSARDTGLAVMRKPVAVVLQEFFRQHVVAIGSSINKRSRSQLITWQDDRDANVSGVNPDRIRESIASFANRLPLAVLVIWCNAPTCIESPAGIVLFHALHEESHCVVRTAGAGELKRSVANRIADEQIGIVSEKQHAHVAVIFEG